MFTWVGPMMWTFCHIVANTMTFIGLAGLLFFAGRGLIWVTDKITEME